MNFPPERAAEIESLNVELAGRLERIAWAILRDWPLSADAVQEAFVLLTQKWPDILPEHRRGWLVRAVQLSAHNLRRKQVRARRLPDELIQRSRSRDTQAEDGRLELEQRTARLEQLRHALGQLPAAQQQIVRLRLVEEWTFAEISRRLELPLGTVLSRMRLALEKLRRNVR